jgi:hypothetical protein
MFVPGKTKDGSRRTFINPSLPSFVQRKIAKKDGAGEGVQLSTTSNSSDGGVVDSQDSADLKHSTQSVGAFIIFLRQRPVDYLKLFLTLVYPFLILSLLGEVSILFYMHV